MRYRAILVAVGISTCILLAGLSVKADFSRRGPTVTVSVQASDTSGGRCITAGNRRTAPFRMSTAQLQPGPYLLGRGCTLPMSGLERIGRVHRKANCREH